MTTTPSPLHSPELIVQKLVDVGVQAPSQAHFGDAGFDLHAAEDVTIDSGQSVAVSTGIAIKLPTGAVGMVCPRSGLAAKHQVTVLNAPGIVDEGYRGEVKVLLINHGQRPFEVAAGDRVAQLVIVPYLAPTVTVLGDGETLDDTDRGIGGFGSTGA